MAKITINIEEYNALMDKVKSLQSENTTLKNKVAQFSNNISEMFNTLNDIKKMPLLGRIFKFKYNMNVFINELQEEITHED